MAINFQDGITVNSGTGSTPTIVAAGARPITLTGGGIGSVAIGGSNGGWATGYFFTGYSGTNRGGFGALGSVDALSYFWIGDAYNDTTMVIQPNAGNVGIGTTSPDSKLELIGDYKQKAADGNSQGFTLSINSSTDAVSLNNYYNASMTFSTNNSAKMTILGSGNVGVGTTNPAYKLSVENSLSVFSSGDTANPKIEGHLLRVIDTANDNPDIEHRFVENHSLNYGFSWFMDGGNNNFSLRRHENSANGTTVFRVNRSNDTAYFAGNVGIGTTSPAAKLDVIQEARVSFASGNQYRTRITNTDGNTRILSDGDTSSIIFGVAGSGTNATAVERMRISSSGNVGVGTTSPSTKLDVNGTFKATSVRSTGGGDGGFVLRQWTYASNYASLATNGMAGLEYCMISDGTNTFIGSGTNGTTRLRGPANDSSPQLEMTSTLCKIDSGDLKVEDGSIAVGTITNSTTNGRIDASNDIVAFSTSDIRLKDNIKSIDKALDKVNSIQGIEFDWIEKEEVHGNSGHDIGVIAQEVEKILPDVVTTRDNGYKAVKYEKIVPLLIEAIKDLSKQVDGLKRLI